MSRWQRTVSKPEVQPAPAREAPSELVAAIGASLAKVTKGLQPRARSKAKLAEELALLTAWPPRTITPPETPLPGAGVEGGPGVVGAVEPTPAIAPPAVPIPTPAAPEAPTVTPVAPGTPGAPGVAGSPGAPGVAPAVPPTPSITTAQAPPPPAPMPAAEGERSSRDSDGFNKLGPLVRRTVLKLDALEDKDELLVGMTKNKLAERVSVRGEVTISERTLSRAESYRRRHPR